MMWVRNSNHKYQMIILGLGQRPPSKEGGIRRTYVFLEEGVARNQNQQKFIELNI